MLKGGRIFTVTDNSGAVVLLAHVRRRFTLFRTRMDIDLTAGGVIELHGNVLGLEFEFRMREMAPARVPGSGRE